ncbi:hypothetical protein NPIL_29231 [Nephila pilipes]|uniref:Uncharacterized protein n=1 Tax=Nephila pilipes TaxID=299642 RepID=A0A8X6QWQ4_NEPPI|nr:hypothetical protein NPIL_29231 [Nephila pilipes]
MNTLFQRSLFLPREGSRHLFQTFTRLSPLSSGLTAFRVLPVQPVLPGPAQPAPETAAYHSRSFACARYERVFEIGD